MLSASVVRVSVLRVRYSVIQLERGTRGRSANDSDENRSVKDLRCILARSDDPPSDETGQAEALVVVLSPPRNVILPPNLQPQSRETVAGRLCYPGQEPSSSGGERAEKLVAGVTVRVSRPTQDNGGVFQSGEQDGRGGRRRSRGWPARVRMKGAASARRCHATLNEGANSACGGASSSRARRRRCVGDFIERHHRSFRLPPVDSSTTLTDAQRVLLDVVGQLSLRINDGDKEPFLVINNLVRDVVLGKPYLRKYRVLSDRLD